MKRAVILIPLLFLAIGCQPPLTREQQLAVFRSRCLDYGYKLGTPEFANCMMKQESRHERMALEMRKTQAIEQGNWLAQEEIRIKEKKLELDRKKRKH